MAADGGVLEMEGRWREHERQEHDRVDGRHLEPGHRL